MAIEKNLTFQLGETWSLEFESAADLAGAELDLDLALGDVLRLSLMSTMSPSPFALDSPAVSGMVTIEPSDQLLLQPEVYNHEVRATSEDGTVSVLQFGKIIVGASLFAWPEASS